jgi:DNA-binding beta-propeller fold protein YncE
VVGPTGVAYDPSHDTLYVASTADNKIFAIGDASDRTGSAGTGYVVFADQKHLHGPLGLIITANRTLITANGDAVFAGGTQNDLVEFTPQGALVATYQMDDGAPGSAFGIASIVSQGAFRLASVDDNFNTVTVWTVSQSY